MTSKREYVVARYRSAVDFSREYLASEVVTIYYYTGVEEDCPDCEYDYVNKESLNIDCPTCLGLGRIRQELAKTLSANVSWRGITESYNRMQLSGGFIEAGDVIISCLLSDALIDPNNTAGETYFDKANYVLVNNRRCKVKTTPMRYGLAGDLYSLAVVLILDSN